MTNQSILTEIQSKTWRIDASSLQSYAHSLDLAETRIKCEEFTIDDFYIMRKPLQVVNGVAEIQIKGVLIDEAPPLYEKLGLVTQYSTIISEIQQAEDQNAEAFLFNVNSPGGSVLGNLEAAQAIAGVDKKTIAYCSGLACSAAYMLAAGTDVIVASPSSQIGNIGTILAWADATEFYKSLGIQMKALVNEGAEYKSTFHLAPNETQLRMLQKKVDTAGQEFKDWVTYYRPDLDKEAFKAGTYQGNDALEMGLLDAVGRLDDTIALIANLT